MFQVLAVALLAVAAFFLYNGQTDVAFVSVVLGVCAFFLSIRFMIKPRVLERNAEREQEIAARDDTEPEKTNDPTD
jgi:hypothetical protein